MSLRPEDDRGRSGKSRTRDRSRSRSNVRSSTYESSSKGSKRKEKKSSAEPKMPGSFDVVDQEPDYDVRQVRQPSAAARTPGLSRIGAQQSDVSDEESHDEDLAYGDSRSAASMPFMPPMPSHQSSDTLSAGFPPPSGSGVPYPQHRGYMPQYPPDSFDSQPGMTSFGGYSKPAPYQYAQVPDQVAYTAKPVSANHTLSFKHNVEPEKTAAYGYNLSSKKDRRESRLDSDAPAKRDKSSRDKAYDYEPSQRDLSREENGFAAGLPPPGQSSAGRSQNLAVDAGPGYEIRTPDGLGKRMNRLSVSGNRPDLQGLAQGQLPPNSPLLEAYKGTYQTASPMPSPMVLPADDDLPPLSELRSLDEMSNRPRSKSDASKKKRVKLYDAEGDAELLAKALKHHEARTGPLIDILPELTHDQLLALREEYKKLVKVQGRGVNISKQIKMSTQGNFGKVAYATSLGRWECEAYFANLWYQSRSSNRELLIEALIGRTNADIREIKASFKDKRYDDDISRCMEKELKADKFRKAVLLALEAHRQEETDVLPTEYRNQDVDILNRALKSRDGGESAIIEVVVTRSDNHLREVLKTYERVYQANFAREALRKSNNLVGEVVAHILNGVINKPARDCLLLRHAIDDIASKNRDVELRYELLMSRLIRLHWDRTHLIRVKQEYKSKYRADLEEDVQEAARSDFGDFCLRLCET